MRMMAEKVKRNEVARMTIEVRFKLTFNVTSGFSNSRAALALLRIASKSS